MDNKTFIGVYHNETDLMAKMDELKAHGYAEEDMYVTAKDKEAVSMVRGQTNAEVETAGGSWGDRFMSFLSGVDPIRGAFRNMGVSDEEADRYYTEVENGGFLLYVDRDYGSRYDEDYDPSRTVGIADGNRADVEEERLTPIDYDRLDEMKGSRSATGTANGVTDPNLGGNLYSADDKTLDSDRPDPLKKDRAAEDTLSEEETLRLHEERLNVNKERVQTGEVYVEKEVIEEEQVIDVPVEREEVFVERRPVTDGDLTAADNDLTAFDEREPAFREDEDTIRVPITEERVEVTKKPVVTEEVVIGKRKVEDTETVRDTVRREEAHIEEDGSLVGKDKLRKDRDDLL